MAARYGGRSSVRVVVIGDAGTGKSSIIAAIAPRPHKFAALARLLFGDSRVLPPTHLPADYFRDGVPVTIVDTSSRPEDQAKVIEEVKAADAIVLTYAPEIMSSVSTLYKWLEDLVYLQVRVPVIVVGYKFDLCNSVGVRDINDHFGIKDLAFRRCFKLSMLETVFMPILSKDTRLLLAFPMQVGLVFNAAQYAALYPKAPLFDQETQSIHRRCMSALKRIFVLCDHDMDGLLSDAEMNDLQVKCFKTSLQPYELESIKELLQTRMADGVRYNGLTVTGFLVLHTFFIKTGCQDKTWTVLREFGYGNDMKISSDILPASIFNCAPDQSFEPTKEAVDFLKYMFTLFNTDNDEVLKPAEIDNLFSTAPESPWSKGQLKDGLSFKNFLSKWSLMTLLDPAGAIANLIYIGYNSNPASAFHITRQRSLDRKNEQSERNVFQCFVFGPKSPGKSFLLDSLIEREFCQRHTRMIAERYFTNTVELPGPTGSRKTLIMREVPEHEVKSLLSKKDSLACCDIAVFVHDSSIEISCNNSIELLVQVASHGEKNGFAVPCLVVSAEDVLNRDPSSIQDLTRACQDMGIEAPIPVRMNLRDLSVIFSSIVIAAQQPHLSIPEIVVDKGPEIIVDKALNQYCWPVNWSLLSLQKNWTLLLVSVGAVVLFVAFLVTWVQP